MTSLGIIELAIMSLLNKMILILLLVSCSTIDGVDSATTRRQPIRSSMSTTTEEYYEDYTEEYIENNLLEKILGLEAIIAGLGGKEIARAQTLDGILSPLSKLTNPLLVPIGELLKPISVPIRNASKPFVDGVLNPIGRVVNSVTRPISVLTNDVSNLVRFQAVEPLADILEPVVFYAANVVRAITDPIYKPIQNLVGSNSDQSQTKDDQNSATHI